MSGLLKNNSGGTFLNVKQGYIVKPVKNEKTGKWEVFDENKFGAISGWIKSLNVIEKKDNMGLPYKELQVGIQVVNESDNTRYILTHRMYKPFSDGLILSLANADDMSKEFKISAYIKQAPAAATGIKASTLCAVRYADNTDTNISWVDGVPAVEILNVEGEEIKSRKKKDIFINKLVEELQERIKAEQRPVAELHDDDDDGEKL